MSETVEVGKEADHHPYKRPRDAATLMLVDRSGPVPKVLVGKRHDKVVFMPGKFVFPGGSVDKTDNRVPVAAPMPAGLEANLMKGSPKTLPSRARSLAIAAIREACEETGLCLGSKAEGPAKKLNGPWQAFSDAGLLPDPSGLFLIARAITPPGRSRRFDARFFMTDAVCLLSPEPTAGSGELDEIAWLRLEAALALDLPSITRFVLGEVADRLERSDRPVPFVRMVRGRHVID